MPRTRGPCFTNELPRLITCSVISLSYLRLKKPRVFTRDDLSVGAVHTTWLRPRHLDASLWPVATHERTCDGGPRWQKLNILFSAVVVACVTIVLSNSRP